MTKTVKELVEGIEGLGIVWLEKSCCSQHRNGVITFPDGETIYLNETNEDVYAAKSVRDDKLNVDSKRVPGGYDVQLTAEEFLTMMQS